MKKRQHTSIVCDQEDSRSYGFQCEKSFTHEHQRKGLRPHCIRCKSEEKEGEE